MTLFTFFSFKNIFLQRKYDFFRQYAQFCGITVLLQIFCTVMHMR